jgi:FAD/FMN-containing dehydrogenase/Fe-S oxidoreductase
MSELAHVLKNRLRGDVRFDTMSRWLYSTDASSYQVYPTGVVVARDADDVAETVKAVAEFGLSVVPRGGGSSLSGQTVGPGVVIDHSRYLDQILELNVEERWVRVQSGMVLDQLNRVLAQYNLMVGPDPASSMVATLGGMTGNNSTGSHSIRYGMVADHVTEVDVVLSDGSQARFGPGSIFDADSLAGRIAADLPQLLDRYRDDIATGYPNTWRSVAGYNLNRLAKDPANLAPLIVGSEGTLGVITAVKLNVVERPAHTRLAILNFDTLREALAVVPAILETGPAAVELVDRYFNNLTRQSPEYGPRLNWVIGDPRAVLIVEYAGSDERQLADQTAKLEKVAPHIDVLHITDPGGVLNVWTVRKAGLGLLMSQRGDAKPLAFVDDASVPVENLADYAVEFERICHDAGTEAAFYAHASAGCLHINPVIDLKTGDGLRQMREISQAVAALAISYDGTTTGEHGEGFARSHYNEQLFGPRLHQAFREVKGLFDPENRLNPGKVIDAPEPWDPDVLRFQPGYSTVPVDTILDFSHDGGFAGLVEMCNGQGVCRKRDAGAMCPSFMATRDEAHSTRGRANALRAAMTGKLGPDGLASQELHDVLDLCLECKACKRECPSLVDMAKLKYEFLHQYQAVHGVPLRSRLFANIHTLNKLGSRVSPALVNWGYRNPLVRGALDRLVGIDARRSLPELAPTTFQRWFHQRTAPAADVRPRVVLWDDTYLSYNETEVGKAAVAVLEAAGYAVELVKNRQCCGRPMISKGLLEQARANATHNITLLHPYAAQGIPIVGIEPSCITTLRDEYPDLVPSDAARTVAANSFFIEEFLRETELPFAGNLPPETVLVHGHCYQKAITGTGPLMEVLKRVPNATVSEIPSGCCGMAGSFGYEKEHYDVSMAAGEDRLFPAVRDAGNETTLLAAGISCRHQIKDGTGRQAIHPVVWLAEKLIVNAIRDKHTSITD